MPSVGPLVGSWGNLDPVGGAQPPPEHNQRSLDALSIWLQGWNCPLRYGQGKGQKAAGRPGRRSLHGAVAERQPACCAMPGARERPHRAPHLPGRSDGEGAWEAPGDRTAWEQRKQEQRGLVEPRCRLNSQPPHRMRPAMERGAGIFFVSKHRLP